LERAVIVTGSGNGTNNRITLDALARMGGTFKGVALLSPDISEPELLKLKEAVLADFVSKPMAEGVCPTTIPRK
jgi:uncharacterized SAM-dependent methyltransferase